MASLVADYALYTIYAFMNDALGGCREAQVVMQEYEKPDNREDCAKRFYLADEGQGLESCEELCGAVAVIGRIRVEPDLDE